jgi:glyoxylase-like metal-dependent hydrolase (beta-lactamase superfamily II)
MDWKVGNVRITQVRESLTAVPREGLLPDSDPAVFEANQDWLRPHFVNDDGSLALSIHALVLESQGETIVVDTCVGDRPIPAYESISNKSSSFLADFAAAGFSTSTVDVVLCTHLHFDHVGWNTRLVDGNWVPTFPNARYLFAKSEYEFWESGQPGPAVTFNDAVRPVVAAGLAELVATDHRINSEIWLEPTPGHTPGHVSVRISSHGEDAVITGDMVHHPIQLVAPEWKMSADNDSARASATRIEFRQRYADTAVTIFGTHFGGPGCGHLRRAGESFRFEV